MTAIDPTAEGAVGVPASSASTTEPSVSPESDFKARARQDPNFAWQQVQQFQSRADKLQSAEDNYNKLVEQLGGAKALIDQYGGGTIEAAVKNYAALRNSPELSEMIQAYEQTGQLPTRKVSESNMDTEDEYKTPEEKRIEALENEVKQLRGSQSETTLVAGRETLQRHMETVFGEYAFMPADVENMRKAMTTQFENWRSMGPAGEAAMKSLMTPNGDKTVRGIMLSAVTPEALRAAATNVTLRKSQGLSGLATDRPSGTASTGMEPPPVFRSAIEAANFARANPEAHDSF